MRPRPSDPFFALVQKARDSSGEIDLARGALLIALQTYPNLDIEHYLRQLDALSEDFRARYAAADSLPASLANLSQYVFGDLGFRGNRAHYDDPRNSYLNEVLDRRLGIPITLAVVYLELGKRLSFPLAGVNFRITSSCAAPKATSRSSSIPLPTALLSMASPWASGYRSLRDAGSNWSPSLSSRPRRCTS